MSASLAAEADRLAEVVVDVLSGLSYMVGVPPDPLGDLRGLADELAADLAMCWSACAVMADWTQPIRVED